MLSLKADIVLSPGFCATKKRQSIAIKDVLNVGKSACAQLVNALMPVFSDLRRIEKASEPGKGTAEITLVPRFADINATQQPFLPSSRRSLIVLLEWTVQDSTGRTIWLQTIQGSSEHKAGWIITTKSVSAMVDDAISVLANESAQKISAAPEIRRLIH